MSDTSQNNKRIAKNTLLLYARMLLLMAVSLYTSRVVLRVLGVEDYGIYNVVGGIVLLFSFISSAMTFTTQRFLNYAMGEGDNQQLKQVFFTSIIIHLGISLFILVVSETIGLWFLYNKIVVSEERFHAALWCYQFSIFTTCFAVLSFPYNAAIIAHEKMGAFAYISIFDAIAKLLIVFLLLISNIDRLILYGILMMTIQFSITFIYVLYCIKKFPETEFAICKIDRHLLKDMLAFSGWNLFGNIAHICLTQCTNIMLNLFFGPAVNAANAISVHVQKAVFQFCSNFQTAQNPQIVKSYAAKNYEYMHGLIFRASRFSFYLCLIFSIPIIFETIPILKLWLGEFPEHTATFVQLAMCIGLVQSLAGPVFTGCLATGNIKRMMFLVSLIFWAIVPLSYFALQLGGAPEVAFLLVLSLHCIAHLIRVKIVGRQLEFSFKQYSRKVFLPMSVVFLPCVIIAYAISNALCDDRLSILLIRLVLDVIICSIMIFFLGLSRHERKVIVQYVFSKIGSFNK